VSRLSLGNGSGRPRSQPRPAVAPQGRVVEPRGSVVNYPTNPRFRPRVVFRSVETSEEMEQRQGMLSNHALVITEEGPMGIQSREEVKDVIWHQFGIRKHECYVYRNYPEPYIVIFPDSHDRDIVFAMGRAVDGPIILAFHSWDLDRFGTRDIIPYHVRLSIEGLPHHVWSRDLANKVLCAEAIVHFVEEDSRDRVDFRAYRCWAYCKDPSRLPQEVFLSLSKHEKGPRGDAQVHFVRPTGVKEYHVFRVLVHIDAVEYLLFYHHPRNELLADGKVPWREFSWQFGRPDGELDEEDLHPPPTRFCRNADRYRRCFRDEEEGDRDQKRPRTRSFIDRVSGWMDGRSRDR
jgi:hypothetical protein